MKTGKVKKHLKEDIKESKQMIREDQKLIKSLKKAKNVGRK